MTEFDRWFRCYQPAQRFRAALVCFPPAGSGASAYRSWAPRLPPGLQLLAVQYPGRQDRLDEPCLRDMHELADRVADALGRVCDRPIVLFGHSLGAAAAYEVARRLERRRVSLRLVVSGRPAAGFERPTAVHAAGDDALWDDLRRLGGTSPAVLENRELRELLLPILRNDYAMSESYCTGDGEGLSCPLAACVSESDPDVRVDEAEAWHRSTRGAFQLWRFPGDHFYFVPQASNLISRIAHWCEVDNWLELWPPTP